MIKKFTFNNIIISFQSVTYFLHLLSSPLLTLPRMLTVPFFSPLSLFPVVRRTPACFPLSISRSPCGRASSLHRSVVLQCLTPTFQQSLVTLSRTAALLRAVVCDPKVRGRLGCYLSTTGHVYRNIVADNKNSCNCKSIVVA